jgi:hypothetical protein
MDKWKKVNPGPKPIIVLVRRLDLLHDDGSIIKRDKALGRDQDECRRVGILVES